MKKIIALLLALMMVVGLVACGSTGTSSNSGNTSSGNTSTGTPSGGSSNDLAAPVYEDMGTIMWLSNLTSGPQYDSTVAYLTACCEALGYDFLVVYGDMMNDAANNLLAVQNSMSDDVVGLITSQDGGLAAIMEEYPELWVAGYNTDLRSVYTEGGDNAACLSNPKFLGTVADGYGDGFFLGKLLAEQTIAAGHKKVALINFPVFAYPNLTEAVVGFNSVIEEYNKTASEPITVVGEVTTLMFAPLEESWFLEEGRSDLDAIIGLCAGVTFVYPTMVAAIANGTCSPDTKLITSGFETDPDIIADIGENGKISSLLVSAAENPAYGLILIDNAITGNVAAGTNNACIDSAPYLIDSAEDINNVMTKSLMGTGDVSLAHLSVDEIVALCGRTNPNLTWAELVAAFQAISVDDLK